MRYFLRPGVSFCDVSSRLIFLDLPSDRYFCLSPRAERSFRRLVGRGEPESGDETMLARLAMGGPLSLDGGPPVLPCTGPGIARESLLDAPRASTSGAQLLAAALALALAPLELKWSGLHRSIERLAAHQDRARPQAIAATRLRAVAEAFRRLRAVATAHDHCLPHSLAVARRLTSRGVNCQLVIAVKLQPFAAHAWVQSGEWLVNDRLDAVRDFTPILVVG